ncbi:MAG: dethiobiotin synthase [Ginsengibacter sp.]
MKPIFITGTGTNVGKTIVAAIITEALKADYWKPVQAGFENGTDSLIIKDLLSNNCSVVHPETYMLSLPASPHLAAAAENQKIKIGQILKQMPLTKKRLVIEGAGGLLVPLNKKRYVADLIERMNAKVVIVSKNELGSINHSLLTAYVLKQKKIKVAGWIFTGTFMDYEEEIADRTGYPIIASIPELPFITREIVQTIAANLLPKIEKFL